MATVEIKRGVICSNCYGGLSVSGVVADDVVLPEGLTESTVLVLDMGDGDFYLLASPAPIQMKDAKVLDALAAGELRRTAVGKLSDVELAALGVPRDV